jgi:LysR family glycine cleavage system transcriptional activator
VVQNKLSAGGGILRRPAINFNSLRVFESVARHLTITHAAEELGITHAAVSHRIRMLEARLGVRLFHRTRRGVNLTTAGSQLLPVIEEAFDRISETLKSIGGATQHQTLTVTTTPSFALRWFIPRLRSLRGSGESGFDVHLRPTLRILDIARGEADIAIRSGIPPWPGTKSEFLMPVHMTPVCSPQLLRHHTSALSPADLLKFTLLHADIGNVPVGNEWRTWFSAAGLGRQKALPGLSFQDPSLAFEAAISGAGIALGYVELITEELNSGELVRPFELQVQHDLSYHLVYAQSRENETLISAFRRWIFDQISSPSRSAKHRTWSLAGIRAPGRQRTG